MPKMPLGGQDTDHDSKKSRGKLINMIAEANRDMTYRTVKRCDGLTSKSTALGVCRSNILVNNNYAYFISGANLYRMDEAGTSTSLGTVNGSGEGHIMSNSVPGNNQICVLNGSGLGYIYNNSGLVQITDVDFFPTTSGTVLNERFWFIRDGTNEFFCSEISDGFSYDPLGFASAEESPDFGISIIAKRSSIWVIGSETMEYWQTFSDVTFPLRKVRSSTIERGIKAQASLAEISDSFAFLADDLTVILVTGNGMSVISDLNFNLKVRGNGTTTSPGFTSVSDAYGFFVDSPTHKIYYLTFPNEGYTWGYDLTTGLSHTRKTESLTYWRGKYSAKLGTQIIVGDAITSTMWILDPSSKTEGAEIQRVTIRTPGFNLEQDATIPLIEIDMEVGQIEDPTVEPMMMVRYSKDGGYNWHNHSNISLGTQGDYRRRIPIKQFGRLVRYKDFMLELTVTDPVRFQLYGAYPLIEVSI